MIEHMIINDNKENTSHAKMGEMDYQTSIESKALEHIQNNLIFVINLTNLHNYYQWVSLYPNLEKLCSTRFINDSTIPKQNFGPKGLNLTSEKNILDTCNFVEKFVKDFIHVNFTKIIDDEEIKADHDLGLGEKVIFPIKEDPCLVVKTAHKLSSTISAKLTHDKVQIFKDPECFNDYPHTKVISEDFYSESRFRSFIDTFNSLFDLIKGKLLRTKTFNQKYKERCERIIEIYQGRGLVKESYSCSSNVRQQLANSASLNERIEDLHAKVKEKEAIIKLKEKVAKESYENKRLLKNEIQMTIEERMEKLNDILQSLDRCSSRDMNNLPNSFDKCTEHEKKLLEVLLHIIFLKDVPDAKFSAFVTKTLNMIQDKDQLISILRARRDTTFTENTVSKIKTFTQKWSDDKFDKVVFKLICKFLQGLVKKINLRVMLESRYEKLEEVNDILIQSELDVAYYKRMIDEYKEELEDLLIKQKNSSDDVQRKSRSITEEEARNEQVYKEVMLNLKKAEGKLVKSKIRMKNLFGDCIMLATSINYLGVLTQDEKTLVRKNVAEALFADKNIEVSEYWHSDNENENAKIFKKLL